MDTPPHRLTTLGHDRLRLPVAPIGPDNPLPPLRPPAEAHRIGDADDLPGLPADMVRQIRYGRLSSLLPCRIKDGYGRDRTVAELDALVLDNGIVRATVVPGLGGRLWSLEYRGRELLFRNPVLQPANLGLTGAWFAGGVEWNLGSTGHTTLTCEPVCAAEVPGPDGTPILRLWEWERTRDLPYQVDLWLPPGSAFLYVGVRVRNPHDHEVPAYWWSNIAVPERPGTRVLAPADAAWNFGYERRLRRVPFPHWEGMDRSYPARATYASDFFYDIAPERRRWIAAIDDDGRGFVQTSTDLLRGRKLFLWGTGPGGQRWQDWLTEPGTGRYLEIQAGLARTQLEHLPLSPSAELAWLEAYGPVEVDAAAAHGQDWEGAIAAVEDALARALPRPDVDETFETWRRDVADTPPSGPPLARGSGWGALEVARGGYALPGTPFRAPYAQLGPGQAPWLELLRTGTMPEGDPALPPGPGPVSRPWLALLEAAPDHWLSAYHRGLARWRAGDRAGAIAAWELSYRLTPTPWAARNLAVADAERGRRGFAAKRLLEAFDAVVPAADAEDDARDGGRDSDGEGAGERESGRASGGASGGQPDDGQPAGDGRGGVGATRGAHGAGTVGGVVDGAGTGGEYAAAVAALARETVEALLAAGRAREAKELLARLPASLRARGRFRLLEARALLATGDRAGARAVFETGFDLADHRENDPTLRDTWAAITDDPLPGRYDFRMHARG